MKKHLGNLQIPMLLKLFGWNLSVEVRLKDAVDPYKSSDRKVNWLFQHFLPDILVSKGSQITLHF